MESYDTSTEHLRARVEKLAEQISQQLAKTPAGEQAFFISDVVHAVENFVGDVVNVAHDAVNAAVNTAHDLVNAAENIGERAVHATQQVVHATEEAVAAVTAHTAQVLQAAQFAAATVAIVKGVVDLAGAEITTEGVEKGKSGGRGSAAQLIQARRAVILEQRDIINTGALAKRAEIKAKVEAVAARIRSSRVSGS